MSFVTKSFKLFGKSFIKAFAVMIAFVFALFFFVALVTMASKEEVVVDTAFLDTTYYSGQASSADELLLIPIHGIILTERSTDQLSSIFDLVPTYGYEIKDQLKKAAENDAIKGVLLHIDSPGGTVVGAKAIADGVAEYREATGKPVFAYISGSAASGGYWAAVATDRVIADTGTSVGSIGVIFGPFKYYDGVISEDGGILAGGVVTENGIETTYITAGRSKDIGNPYRQLTPEELVLLQESVDDVYGVFVETVAEGREVSEQAVRDEMGAMIYAEEQALSRKMIDAVGTREDSIAQLAKAAGLSENEYKVVSTAAPGEIWASLFGVSNLWQPERVSVKGCPLSRVALAYSGDVSALCQ